MTKFLKIYIFKSHREGRKIQGDRLTHCWYGLYPLSIYTLHHSVWVPYLLIVLVPCYSLQVIITVYIFQQLSIAVLCKHVVANVFLSNTFSPTLYSSAVGFCLTGRQPGQVAAWNLCRRDSSAHWLISLRSRLHPSFHSVKHFFFSPEVLSGLSFHLLTVSFSHVT